MGMERQELDAQATPPQASEVTHLISLNLETPGSPSSTNHLVSNTTNHHQERLVHCKKYIKHVMFLLLLVRPKVMRMSLEKKFGYKPEEMR